MTIYETDLSLMEVKQL